MNKKILLLISAAAILLTPAFAHAHNGASTVGGFVSGFSHPLTGLDHIVAMFAVGLWGAFLGAPAIWLLPVVFPLVMAIGGAFGILGVPMFGIELGIAISAIVLGIMVAGAVRPPIWIAAVIVGFFAIFHGYAHGRELPNAANPISYAVGFVISTGLLHLSGIAFSLLTRWKWGNVVVRGGGVIISLIGFGFLFGIL